MKTKETIAELKKWGVKLNYGTGEFPVSVSIEEDKPPQELLDKAKDINLSDWNLYETLERIAYTIGKLNESALKVEEAILAMKTLSSITLFELKDKLK